MAKRQGVFAHVYYAEKAAEAAHVLYEQMCKDNVWYANYRKLMANYLDVNDSVFNADLAKAMEYQFCVETAPMLLQYVIRASLELLKPERTDVSPEEKEKLFAIYMADQALPLAKERGAMVLPGADGFTN